jgi:hypothetical protein
MTGKQENSTVTFVCAPLDNGGCAYTISLPTPRGATGRNYIEVGGPAASYLIHALAADIIAGFMESTNHQDVAKVIIAEVSAIAERVLAAAQERVNAGLLN